MARHPNQNGTVDQQTLSRPVARPPRAAGRQRPHTRAAVALDAPAVSRKRRGAGGALGTAL
jgi:hypothetical protein